MIQLIAIDLDGTCLDSNRELTTRNIQALAQAHQSGVKVVICTGRTFSGVKHLLQQLPFFGENDYIILQNGAEVRRFPQLEVVYQGNVSYEVREALLQVRQQHHASGIQMVAFDADKMYLIEDAVPNKYVAADAKALFTDITPLTSQDFVTQPLVKVMFLGAPEALDILQQSLPNNVKSLTSVVRSQAIIMECLPQGVTKATGVDYVGKVLNIVPTAMMAIGDQLNDVEMLQYVGHSVAMGNALNQVKDIATVVTDTNDNSGVAQAIEHVLLKNKQ